MKEKKQGGLYRSFLVRTLFPVLFFGVIVIIVNGFAYTKGLHREVQNGLRSVAESVLIFYDEQYEGDYNLLIDQTTLKYTLKKGETVISGSTEIMDEIASQTGLDLSIFFYDTRMLTTIKGDDGERVIGTTAHPLVMERVVQKGQECFFDNVVVGGHKYFAEYVPIFGSDGTCIGMIGAAKSAKEVTAAVNNVLLKEIGITLFVILLTSFFIHRFTVGIVGVLTKMKYFLGDIAKGDLNTELDPVVLNREDEIGEMGQFTVFLQSSLRKLVERDGLTGLYNRRSGEVKLHHTIRNAGEVGESFILVMGDIDHFKKVNDEFGHEAGDVVLKEIASILMEKMIYRGYAIRWGGEEFLLVFEKMDLETVEKELEKLLQEIGEHSMLYQSHEIKVTMTFGVTEGIANKDMTELVTTADERLYYGKKHGRNRVVIKSE